MDFVAYRISNNLMDIYINKAARVGLSVYPSETIDRAKIIPNVWEY